MSRREGREFTSDLVREKVRELRAMASVPPGPYCPPWERVKRNALNPEAEQLRDRCLASVNRLFKGL